MEEKIIHRSTRKTHRVTIDDVARHAGVSHMTVSRVINGRGPMKEATRLAVTAAIKELRYSPNPAARNLAGTRSFVIGLCYSNPTDSYLAEILLGSFAQAKQCMCQVVLERHSEESETRQLLAGLMESGVDGVILTPPLCNTRTILEALQSVDMPAVLVTSGRPVIDVPTVSIDDRKASRAMTRHLLGLGHKRIAFIRGNPSHSASELRLQGFEDAMQEAKLPLTPKQVAQGLFTYQSGLEATQCLLDSGFNPTAIFASNEEMALAAMALAFRRGLDVPDDLSIAGFDDSPMAGITKPGLTAVRRPIADMAAQAVRMLDEQLRARQAGRACVPTHTLMEFSIIQRGSTGFAPPSTRG